ncbi:hypothetical protein NE865_01066 [Phthorimaea operculella]|nr:hypothetical protein NE865_01066 [Phthorimaea operculella]
MSKNYSSWSLPALKAELEKRNAKRTGKKATPVQRLEDYDKLFGDIVTNPESSYKIQAPDAKLFQDVNTDIFLPVLDNSDLETFCSDDKIHAANMYRDYFLLTFRVACQGPHHFISSQCAAEMKKNVHYNVLIKYEAHTIIETQCECAAGVGPHATCKHVVAVLYGLIDFTSRKILNVRSSCTAHLQTFHHPAEFYKGSPIPILQIATPANKKAIFHDHDYMEKSEEDRFWKSCSCP